MFVHPSASTLGQQCDSDSERKHDSPNVSFIENCEDPASWPTRLSTAQRDFLIAKGQHKLDLNYEFPKDVTDRKFSSCYLQRKLSNGEVMQRKWLVYSAGKIGYFAFVVSFFLMLMPRYPLGFLTGPILVALSWEWKVQLSCAGKCSMVWG